MCNRQESVISPQVHPSLRLLSLLYLVVLLTGCAAGDARFSEQGPAGFLYGLWHGVISVITLVIHIFNDSVLVYETNNVGGWYDFGFLLGVIVVWGGGCHAKCRSAEQKRREQEWDEIGDKVEKKVMRKLNEWSRNEEVTGSDEEWEEVCEKVEKKLKRKMREWAEKE